MSEEKLGHPLAVEISTYEKHLPEWVAQNATGKFALVRGTEVGGLFTTHEEAMRQGYAQFGGPPFLVKQVSPFAIVHYISRAITPCRT